MKVSIQNDINNFYNNLTSHFFAPYVLQPTRPRSKTLIDNIFINTVEYSSFSGNLTIELSDHLFQFVILEGFFKELVPKNINLYERNFKNFNEREFEENISLMDWDTVLELDKNDPSLSTEHLHNTITFLLDELAPYRKITKKEFKLKSKPWINNDILKKMNLRDKLLLRYHKSKESDQKEIIYEEY